MHTPYTEQLAERYGAESEGQKAAYMARMERQVPMNRIGDAWDVAHAVLFFGKRRGQVYHGTGDCGGWGDHGLDRETASMMRL